MYRKNIVAVFTSFEFWHTGDLISFQNQFSPLSWQLSPLPLPEHSLCAFLGAFTPRPILIHSSVVRIQSIFLCEFGFVLSFWSGSEFGLYPILKWILSVNGSEGKNVPDLHA
jgi:hypothetical protein